MSERADVAIVGGGLAGLATAWGLAERGVGDVIVLERGPAPAGHASARNAAMCRALAEDDAWTELTAAGAALLRSPPPSLAVGPLVDDRGAALLSRSPAIRAALAARAERHRIRCGPVDPARLARWPGLALAAGDGLWFPDDGVIDLAGLVEALVKAARRAGARIICDADVLSVSGPEARSPRPEAPRANASEVELHTGGGLVRAAIVVNAAGAWAGELAQRAGATDPGYQARRRHVFALAASAPDAPIVWDVDEREWYVRPAGPEVWASACDTAVAAPGDVEPTTTAIALLRDRLPPPLDGAPLRRAWACQRTFAPAGVPLIERDRERPWLCSVTGLGGHGVTASLEVGRRAAAVILPLLAR